MQAFILRAPTSAKPPMKYIQNYTPDFKVNKLESSYQLNLVGNHTVISTRTVPNFAIPFGLDFHLHRIFLIEGDLLVE